MRTRRAEIGSSASRTNGDAEIRKRTRSESMTESKPLQTLVKRKSPRRCSIGCVTSDEIGLHKDNESMLQNPSHHPLKPPPLSPMKWRSPRRRSNEIQKGDENCLCKDNGLMPESPPHHPPKSPPQSPVKWRSPRRRSNEIHKGDENGLCKYNESIPESPSLHPLELPTQPPIKCSNESKKNNENGHCKDTKLMPESPSHHSTKLSRSPVKWRSPCSCLNKSHESGLCKDTVPMPESPLCHPTKLPLNGSLNGNENGLSRDTKSMPGSPSHHPMKPPHSPVKWRSPRRCSSGSQKGSGSGPCNDFKNGDMQLPKSPRRRLLDQFSQKPKWNPRDSVQINMVKEALHVSMAPSSIVCREEEQRRVLEFCKVCIEQEKAGSLYVCGCPGTGKTLSIEKVKVTLVEWAKDKELQPPDVLAINCTSLATTSEIFSKILERCPWKKAISNCSPLQHLQKLFSQKKLLSAGKMMLIIIDEMDYLITKDRAVLHNLFMLTTYRCSRFILIGIANAIDLADRFLPTLQSSNCRPMVVTFQAYSKDQILRILQQRLKDLGYDVFLPQALELCAGKVAAASGDMRKALSVCRSAIEMLEAELRDSIEALEFSSAEKASAAKTLAPRREILTKQEMNIVRYDHMVLAVSKAFKSVVVDTIQSLPQHQQIILCSAVKLFHQGKKSTTIGDLNKSYSDICTSAKIPPASALEFSNMCRVLGDQGLLKLGQSREDRQKRVTLKVDEEQITLALQGIRFFHNFLL